MKKGDVLFCTEDKKVYTLIDIPFMDIGLTYYQISDNINFYFVSNGVRIFDNSKKYFNFRFHKDKNYFKEYSNKTIPNNIKIYKDIKFEINPVRLIRKIKIQKIQNV